MTAILRVQLVDPVTGEVLAEALGRQAVREDLLSGPASPVNDARQRQYDQMAGQLAVEAYRRAFPADG